MSKILIVGAGQAGLQLGLGLLSAGHEVTVVSNRPPQDIRDGKVMSSQCMFDAALQHERDLGLAFWEKECPRGRRHLARRAGAGRERHEGDRLGLTARPPRGVRRPAREDPRLDGGTRAAAAARSSSKTPASRISSATRRSTTS